MTTAKPKKPKRGRPENPKVSGNRPHRRLAKGRSARHHAAAPKSPKTTRATSKTSLAERRGCVNCYIIPFD